MATTVTPTPVVPAVPLQDFGWALVQLRLGYKVSRLGWNGKGMWVAIHIPVKGETMTAPYFFIYTVQGTYVPWQAGQTDLLALDWVLAT